MSLERFLCTFFDNIGPYVVLRNYEGLPTTTNGSDIDILLKTGSELICDDSLRTALRAVDGIILGEATTVGFRKVVIMGLSDRDQPPWGGRLDLSFGLKYKGAIDYAAEDVLFSRAIDHNGISVLPTEWANVIGLIKHVLHHNNLPSRYKVGAEKAVASGQLPVATALFPMGIRTLDKFLDLCSLDQNDTRVVIGRIRGFRNSLKFQYFKKRPIAYCVKRILFSFSRLQRLIKPPGLMMSVLGPDGVGKSTTIRAITETLETITHSKVSVRHLRPHLLPSLGRLRSYPPRKGTEVVLEPHHARTAGRIGSFIRLFWLWLDYVFGYFFVVLPRIAKEPTFFIFDRYADDLAIDPTRFRIGALLWVAFFFPRVVPRPNVTILLVAEPAVIHGRKQELPLNEIVQQVEKLQSWATARPEATLVSTGVSLEKTTNTVFKVIFQVARERQW